MTMTTLQSIILIIVVVLGTMLTRFLPFLVFSGKRTPPAYIQYLGTVLPYAAIGLLVVYGLKDSFSSSFTIIPALISIFCVVLLHKWKKNVLLSLGVGTVLYMILVQTCFR